MARLLAIDYGSKRVGVAITDEMQIIASGLTTVLTKDIFVFLQNYLAQENVEKIIVGDPKQMNGLPSESAAEINNFVKQFQKQFPYIAVERIDERFTSKLASKTLLASGLKKQQRKNKGLVDEIAATIILQDYMNSL